MIVVSDNSPISSLLRIGKLDLLTKLYGKVIIPKAVYDELKVLASQNIDIEAIDNANWLEIREVTSSEILNDLKKSLGAGEAEAISLAIELKADVLLMDERKGRKTAKSLGINILGLFGLFLEAKEKGFLIEVKSLIDQLIQEKIIWVSQDLYDKVLEMANE